jgi:hypothetical protein
MWGELDVDGPIAVWIELRTEELDCSRDDDDDDGDDDDSEEDEEDDMNEDKVVEVLENKLELLETVSLQAGSTYTAIAVS